MTYSTARQYDEASGVTPRDFLIEVVADHRDIDPIDLPALHRYVDGDLVDRFLRRPPGAGELRFRWDAVVVTLSADRTVEVAAVGGEEVTRSHGGRSDGSTGIRVKTK